MKQNDLRLEKISVRNVLIDNFKGIVVLLYMMSHIIIHMDSVPEFDTPIWLKHSNPIMIPSWGFNPLDLGPIFFYFVMGFVLFSSFLRKYEKIGRAAYKQVFIRNMAFLGVFLGLQVAAGGFAPPPDLWNTVPSIGFTALLAIPFLHPRISKSPWIKLILGVAVLVFYHFARDILFKYLASHEAVNAGGMAACFGYLGIVLLAGFIADISKKGLWQYAVLTAVLWVVGRFIYLIAIPSYPALNAVYMLSALSKLNLIYFICFVVDKFLLKNRPIPIIVTFGRNILLYLFFVLIAQSIFALFDMPPARNMLDGWIYVGIFTVIYVLTAIPLERSKVMFKL